ncbi:MAG TPA: DUF1275 domain-containing protein [Firmicutes bacterium]|nr:DUF1275 domain-containing protein [Bacillota bacterium]
MEKEKALQAAAPPQAGDFLACEKRWVYAVMTFVGGYFGAFTYSIRGGVFCNAQTGNFVLLAMALGRREWMHALYFLIPISAYCLGAFLSELLPKYVKRFRLIRWDTLFIMVEIAVVIFLGCLPESAPVQITQVLVNFICSMQYNTFRQAEGVPMATTFCTNHIRQVGLSVCKAIQHPTDRRSHFKRMGMHLGMLCSFLAGGVASTFFCGLLLGKAVWLSLIPLGVILADLLYADLIKEKGQLGQVPHGH